MVKALFLLLRLKSGGFVLSALSLAWLALSGCEKDSTLGVAPVVTPQPTRSDADPLGDSSDSKSVPRDADVAQPTKAAEERESPKSSEGGSPAERKASAAKNSEPPPADPQSKHEPPFPMRVKAPSLEGGVGWLNVAGPIDLKQLRGKFVVLDFWTYCCINCMHVLPVLKQLEHAYPEEVVVIGVHSAKFDAEQDSKNIAESILRYNIEHPVINDAEHRVWDAYAAQSWPSLRIIDPEGYLVATHSGEIDFADLDRFFKEALPYYRETGLIDRTPLRFDLEAHRAAATPLRFPGKILADEKSDRLFIADSNHHRIVVTKLNGTLVATIGSGAQGSADGDFATATFNQPQGMALLDDTLYVADTENHLLRKVFFKTQEVVTIAGTGKQLRGWPTSTEATGDFLGLRPAARRWRIATRKTALNSPWALWVHDQQLYIAMAGSHQIWNMPLDESTIGPYAGNGREDIVDGPLLPPVEYGPGSSFAQPSGLTSDGATLFVADSEGSSIRTVPFDPTKSVGTLIGTSALAYARLFTFGDADGSRDGAKLQHPLGVCFHKGNLYVTDTYNNKIKVIRLADQKPESEQFVETIAGGKPTKNGKNEPSEFDEPAGLTVANGKLYVADTNNHRIRTIDLTNGNRVATLEIPGLKAPTPARATATSGISGATEVKLDPVSVKPSGMSVTLQLDLELPSGWKINPLAPMRYVVEAVAESGPVDRTHIGQSVAVEKPAQSLTIDLPISQSSGEDVVKVSLAYYYCQEGSEGLCKAGAVAWTVPLMLTADAQATSIPLPFKVD